MYFIECVENSDVFNSRDEYRKSKFSFYFRLFYAMCNVSSTEKEVLQMQTPNTLVNPDNFGTKIFVTF